MIDRISVSEIQARYDQQDEIWPESDAWHSHLRRQYKRFFAKIVGRLRAPNNCVVNIGSAGDDYSVLGEPHIHIDLSARLLPKNGCAIVADAQALPLKGSCAGVAMAIGSVINYCSALEFLQEASRVVVAGGYLIFDFEQSNGFEHFGDKDRGKSAFLAVTEYDGDAERIWFYSRDFIREALETLGFEIIRFWPVHVLSSLAYGLTKSDQICNRFSKFDIIARHIPGLRNGASNFIVLARKRS